LDKAVRWLHVSELVDIGGLLTGGELLITTGIVLPSDDAGLEAYVMDLATVGAAGLMVEIGHRYRPHLPQALVLAAERHGLILIELARKTQFVRITEAVHTLIINSQVSILQATTEMHSIFTHLSVEGAPPQQVVSQLAGLAKRPVVLEDPGHHVICLETLGKPLPALLQHWERRSSQVQPSRAPIYVEDRGWLVTPVAARGRHWGRLVILIGDRPSPLHENLIERAASTLALNWLLEGEQESIVRQSHRSLLSAVMAPSSSLDDIAVRSEALGVPLEGRCLAGIVLRIRPSSVPSNATESVELRRFSDWAHRATHLTASKALTGVLDAHSVGTLLSLSRSSDPEQALMRWCSAVDEHRANAAGSTADRESLVMAVGSMVSDISEARRSMVEATQVADVAQYDAFQTEPFRVEDIGIRGLLQLLRNDERLLLFVQRQIGALIAYDHQKETDLVATLQFYLVHGRNKTAAADASHLSRPAFYERLRGIQKILRADLDSPDDCVSLHVALTAHNLRLKSFVEAKDG
jgi:purine catabolism regulator